MKPLHHGAEELFGHGHQVFIGGVALIEFEHGEFGVMLGGDPFVSKVPIDLEDPFEPSDHQPLQVELRGNPHEEFHVEGVVMGLERLGRGSSGDRVHHRGLHFEKVPADEELPDHLDGLVRMHEDLFDLGIDDQIDITLTVTGLHIGEPVPLLRKGPKGFDQKLKGLDLDRQFMGLGPEDLSLDQNNVPDDRAF